MVLLLILKRNLSQYNLWKKASILRTARRKNLARPHNYFCYGNPTLPSLCIVFNLYVAVSDVKPLSVPQEFSSRFPLYYCWATEYFVLQSTIWKYLGLHVKCPILLSDFNQISRFYTDFPKKSLISNFMEIRPVGTPVTQAYRTMLIDSFCYLCQRAQKHTDSIHTFLHFFTQSCLRGGQESRWGRAKRSDGSSTYPQNIKEFSTEQRDTF